MMIVYWKRDFTPQPVMWGVQTVINRYAWNATGGPSSAQVTHTGELMTLWEAMHRLRCPVEIFDDRMERVWWGYVHEIILSLPGMGYRIGVSLDEMYNRIWTIYGDQLKTDVVIDDITADEFGTREQIVTADTDDLVQAEYMRDATLQQAHQPQQVIETNTSDTDPYVEMNLRGWWDTLDWKYYEDSGADTVETTDQLEAVITACGQFLTGVDLLAGGSGISTVETQDGLTTGLAVAEKLLLAGPDSKPMYATVTERRRVEIYPEPGRDSGLSWNGKAEFFTASGVQIPASETPARVVGQWAHLRDMLPPTFDFELLADPSWMFIEEAEYAQSGRVTVRPRGMIDPRDLIRAKNG